jgi:sulfate transport system permease protein
MKGAALSRSPGLRWTLAVTLAYLGLVVLVHLGALLAQGARAGADPFLEAFTSPRVRAAFALTFGAALAAAAVNAVFGFVLAWVLVRYRFPGRRLADALVDLPMALPTAVAGIALTALFAGDGWAGRPLAALGLEVNYTPLGVMVALTFIGVPFVVRSVQPVLESLDAELEEAAACLGARPSQTFRRVVLPQVAPAWLAGITLAFARAVGEYGSVVFISGNMPGRTEIVPLLIMTRLESYDYAGATALAILMLAVSVALLVAGQRLEARAGRRAGLA